jgi:hypothetical protein
MSEHDNSQLGAYALGALDRDEARAVRHHLATCAACRQELAELEELKEVLGDVPPEAFLDGPPEDGDLLLQRTLRQVRSQASSELVRVGEPVEPAKSHRWLTVAAAVVVVAGASLGGGVLIGRQTVSDPVATPQVTVKVPGVKKAAVTDTTTGATMTATVIPRGDWSWIEVELSGLKQGAQCELRVTGDDGKYYSAGSWVVSEHAARTGAKFGGGVLLPVGKVKAVEIVTLQDKHVLSANPV